MQVELRSTLSCYDVELDGEYYTVELGWDYVLGCELFSAIDEDGNEVDDDDLREQLKRIVKEVHNE